VLAGKILGRNGLQGFDAETVKIMSAILAPAVFLGKTQFYSAFDLENFFKCWQAKSSANNNSQGLKKMLKKTF
jgi:hypothetical protein